MSTDYELYTKYSIDRNYNEITFKEKLLSYLKSDMNYLEQQFNLAESHNAEEAIIILLAMMRRKAIVRFNPHSKYMCDICNISANVVILKDCFHGYCLDCLKAKVKMVSPLFSYKEYFTNQEKCVCQCGKTITISNLENLNILNDNNDIIIQNNLECEKCSFRKKDCYKMKVCNYTICNADLSIFIKNSFKLAKEQKTLEKMECPNKNCNENIAYLLPVFYQLEEIETYFPNFTCDYF